MLKTGSINKKNRLSVIGKTAIFFSVVFVFTLVYIAFFDYFHLKHDGAHPVRIQNMFTDFFVLWNYITAKNPYTEFHMSYPPSSILIFRPLALIANPQDYSINELTDYIRHPVFLYTYIIYTVVLFSLLICFTAKILRKYSQSIEKTPLAPYLVTLFAAFPTIYLVARGNILSAALLFTLIFIAYYDDKNPALREVAIIALAMAGAIKIYPLIFGIFLLRKKKFFAAVRVAVYFFAIFFLSFLTVEGGFDAIPQFIERMTHFQFEENRAGGMHNFSTAGLVGKLADLWAVICPGAVISASALSLASKIISGLILCCCIFIAFVSKSDSLSAYACGCAICAFPTISYGYVACFFIISAAMLAAKAMPLLSGCSKIKEVRNAFLTSNNKKLFPYRFSGKYANARELAVAASALILSVGIWFPFRFFLLHTVAIHLSVIILTVFLIKRLIKR